MLPYSKSRLQVRKSSSEMFASFFGDYPKFCKRSVFARDIYVCYAPPERHNNLCVQVNHTAQLLLGIWQYDIRLPHLFSVHPAHIMQPIQGLALARFMSYFRSLETEIKQSQPIDIE
jgi:hypothetical protein